jgi:hypothetical protein
MRNLAGNFTKTLAFLLLFIGAQSAFAQNEELQCEDPANLEVVSDWQSREPAHPGMLRLAGAWLVYRRESPIANSLKNDKQAHCYIGCRVSQDVGITTAVYLGWLKEQRDLTDCNPRTHFDPKDEIATLRGSELSGGKANCAEVCKAEFPRKRPLK